MVMSKALRERQERKPEKKVESYGKLKGHAPMHRPKQAHERSKAESIEKPKAPAFKGGSYEKAEAPAYHHAGCRGAHLSGDPRTNPLPYERDRSYVTDETPIRKRPYG